MTPSHLMILPLPCWSPDLIAKWNSPPIPPSETVRPPAISVSVPRPAPPASSPVSLNPHAR
jgi:hypothetical protein